MFSKLYLMIRVAMMIYLRIRLPANILRVNSDFYVIGRYGVAGYSIYLGKWWEVVKVDHDSP